MKYVTKNQHGKTQIDHNSIQFSICIIQFSVKIIPQSQSSIHFGQNVVFSQSKKKSNQEIKTKIPASVFCIHSLLYYLQYIYTGYSQYRGSVSQWSVVSGQSGLQRRP